MRINTFYSMSKFLFSIFILLSSCGFAQDKKALFYLSQGEKEFKLRKYPEALDYFDLYFERDSSSQMAYIRTAQIYESLKNNEKATFYYKKGIAFDSSKVNYPAAYMFLASRAMEKGEYRDAKKYLEVAAANVNKVSMAYRQIQKQISTCDFALQNLQSSQDIRPEKLPETINAGKNQYLPVLTADGQTLIFTLRKENDDEDLMVSTKNNGVWTSPKSISENINTPNREGTCSISVDGKIMVFTSCEGRDSFGSCDLYISKKEGEKWSKPKNLGPKVNSQYWDSQPSLSPDGSTLFFSSDRPQGYGKKDLWMCKMDENGEWQRAYNLGSKINTPADEISPFIHANGSTLFYSSNGKLGMGNQDIFMTDIKNGFGAESVNLGSPINTINNESGMFISADGKTAMYSVPTAENTYIYQFEVPQKLLQQFERIFYLKGFVKSEKEDSPLYASLELVNNKTGERISKFFSDPVTGDYMSVIPSEGEYLLYIEAKGYFFKSIKFKFSEDAENQILDIQLRKIEKEGKVALNNIYFDTGSAELREDSNIELKKLTEMMKRNAKIKLEISGHTDDIGNDKANLTLSSQRAAAVADFLKKNGIPAERLVAIGFGETQPIVKNTSETNRQQNRRIEMKVL